jgi:hypothetical protein
MNIVSIILIMISVYLFTGLVFAIAFITKGVEKVDEGANNAGWGFRLIIIPGTIVFWPVLLKKWLTIPKPIKK